METVFTKCTAKTAACFFGGIIISTCFFASNYIFAGDKNVITSISAMRSLYNGEAKEYDKIADQRTEILLSDQDPVYLDKFTSKPYVLFFDDIQLNPEDGRNQTVCKFYRKKAVYLKETQ